MFLILCPRTDGAIFRLPDGFVKPHRAERRGDIQTDWDTEQSTRKAPGRFRSFDLGERFELSWIVHPRKGPLVAC